MVQQQDARWRRCVIASGLTRTPERLASKDFILLSPYIVNGAAITRRADEPEITGWATVCGEDGGRSARRELSEDRAREAAAGLRDREPRVSGLDRAFPRPREH